MADHAPVLIWMAATDGQREFFNQGWLAFTGRTLEQEFGNGWAEGVHPEDLERCLATYLAALAVRGPFAMEYRLRRHDGEYRWLYDQGAPRLEADGTFAGYIGSCVDVSEQRGASDALKRLNEGLSLQLEERTKLAREREVLLRAVHHRVKNDLQLVSSMLRMQGRNVTDAVALAALEDCQSRVQTIALIHEQMYRSDAFGLLHFAANLQRLATSVFRMANAAPALVTLEVHTEGDVSLSVDRAIPCGLILNELMTNALRHAFPSGRRGTVRVSVRATAPARVALVVADDGVGFPAERAEGGAPTFGWRLVKAFAQQLHADVSVSHEAGTSVTIEFEANA